MPEPTPTPTPPADPPKDPTNPPADPPKDPPADPPADPPKDDTDWKAESRKWETRAKENKAASDTAAQQVTEFKDAIAKAFGLKEDDDPDPKKLAGDLTAAQQDARRTKVENAVLRSAIKEGASPNRLTDSLSFMKKLEALDPASEDFGATVAEEIKTAVKADPTLKATQAAGSSSADHGAGGSGEQGKRTPKSLADAAADHYGA